MKMDKSTNALIYKKMPDGSVPDYNRIYDATDEELSAKKIANKNLERFMYQYADAMRSHVMIIDRIECVEMGLPYDQKRYIKDPTGRIEDCLEREKEIPKLEYIWGTSAEELSDARIAVADMICGLKDKDQKQVMVSHYICGADWRLISGVYGKGDRWAKEIHNKAMEEIGQRIRTASGNAPNRKNQIKYTEGGETNQTERNEAVTQEALREIAKLKMEWKNAEHEWKIRKRNEPRIPDDIRLVFGV